MSFSRNRFNTSIELHLKRLSISMNQGFRLAARMHEIAPFHVMEILARAHALEAQGRSLVHMEVGEPDFVTAGPIVAAGQEALAQGATRYTNAVGIPELRSALAAFYRARYAIEVDANQIVITPGASGALQLALGVLVDPGERVLMADPGYPCNRHFVRFVNGDALPIAVGPETGYQLTAELVEKHWTADTAAVMVASPSNPTGTLISRRELEAIAEVARQRGGRLIVDEIYQGLTYEEREQTVLTLDDQAFVVNSFSKYFGMTGWRLGWLVVPDGYLNEVTKLAQNLFVSPSAVAQYAAVAAFEPETLEILESRRHEFGRRRDFLIRGLRELGFGIARQPEGAFYLYADCTPFSADSQQFAMRLLEESGVAITPGIDFGEHRARAHVRFAYTTSMAQLQEGVDRIADFLGTIAGSGDRRTVQP